MKIKHKKIIISTTALFVAGILTVGTLLQSSVSVQASDAMMPGVETIVNETSETNPFRILEIVDDTKEAEIGYYVSGQEPYFKLYKYSGSEDVEVDDAGNKIDYENFTSVEDVLSKLPTSALRRDFMQNTKEDATNPDMSVDDISDENMTDLTGIKNIRSICGDDGPLSYQQYQETYFPSEEQIQNWNKIDLITTRTEKIKGTYIKSETGVGDYQRKELSFYPVREDTADRDEETAKYVENIDGFAYGDSGQTQPYKVEFTGIADVTQEIIDSNYVDGKGLYTNVYGYLNGSTVSDDFARFPGELSEIVNTATEMDEQHLNVGDEFQSDAQFDYEDAFSDDSVFSSGENNEEDLFSSVDSTVSAINPMIYRDEEIDIFPFHRYYEVGTFNEVKEQLKNSNDPDFQLTSGVIYQDIEENYYYWDDITSTAQRLVYVIGREKQPYSNTQEISGTSGIPYYYYASAYELACKSLPGSDSSNPENYQYYGWYYALNPENEDRYREIEDGEKADFYSSSDEFYFAPGMGEYNFMPDDTQEEQDVQVKHFYYTGGYTNHDWMKQYVFNLFPELNGEVNSQFDTFKIEVDTLTTEQFNLKYSPEEAGTENQELQAGELQTGDMQETDIFDDNSSDSNDPDIDEESKIEGYQEELENTLESEEQADSEDSNEAGEESQVEPMLSEAMDDLVSFETSQSDFSDGDIEDIQEDEGISFFSGEDTNPTDSDSMEENLFSADEEINFTAGDEETDTSSFLDNYDLIYINGKLSNSSASVIANYRLPCIINQDKAIADDGTETGIQAAFSEYIKSEDADKHYVTENVYFFRNTDESVTEGNVVKSNLVNIQFGVPFYTEEEEFSDGILPPAALGFEEILDYIHTENQYRDVENQGSNIKINLLSVELSQARAVEYILNYKYKRQVNMKDKINVLEIQPAKGNSQLTEVEVLNWIFSEKSVGLTKRVLACCTVPNKGRDATNIVDGNEKTFWHNDWQTGEKDDSPRFVVEISGDASLIKGITYTPRKDGEKNGNAIKYRITVLKSLDELSTNGTEISGFEYEGKFNGGNGNYSESQTVMFDQEVPSTAKYIKFEFVESYGKGDKGNKKLASCAEFSLVTSQPEINITTMTSSEYVGHIDDINSKYDMIYIGDGNKNLNKFINGDSGMLYTHVGGIVGASEGVNKTGLMGMMNCDYMSQSGSYPIEYNTYKWNQKYTKRITLNSPTASFRGSGNDITKQQYNELLNFVKSGYPVILGDDLWPAEKGKVDTSSYWYQFISEAQAYPNVKMKTQVKLENDISFFTYLSKPLIDFGNEDEGKPIEVQRVGGDVADSATGFIGNELKYEFTIKNDIETSYVNTTYDCELFLDLNFDGNYSELEEQEKYIEIKDESQNVLPQIEYENKLVYQLKAGQKYTLVRKIPSDYYKVIAWKLQISNNANNNIRTSVTGYSKQSRPDGQAAPNINVLQLMPDKGIQGPNGQVEYQNGGGDGTGTGTWNLEKEMSLTSSTFKALLKPVKDFDVSIKSVTISEFESKYYEELNGYQMLIIGFDDVVQNISNENGQVTKILEFIKAGKSVIFAHDTTSNINWDYEETSGIASNGKWLLDTTNSGVQKNFWLWKMNRFDWGLELNKVLREVVGMDRYGITSSENLNNMTVSELLKQGKSLVDGGDIDGITDSGKNVTESVNFGTLMKLAGDIAYTTTTSIENETIRSSSYPQTQGYTNIQLINYDTGSNLVYKANKVNDGAITQYPYAMADTINIAGTHGQYYQLALEQDRDINNISDDKNDIVVWYCLSGNKYDDSPNDARNNYYFYSKGNVIYTGAGHSTVNKEDEIKLFINAIIAAANVTAVQPEVYFVKSINPKSEVEKVRYYMTDQSKWLPESGNLLESDMEFYFSVKDYNMVSSNMNIVDQKNQDMTVEFFIEDDENGSILSGTDDEVLPQEVKTTKLSSITNQISGLSEYGGSNSVTRDENGLFHLSKNNTFGFTLKDIEKYLHTTQENPQYYSNRKLYVKVSSTVTLYNVPNKKTSWARLDLKQRQLFPLD